MIYIFEKNDIVLSWFFDIAPWAFEDYLKNKEKKYLNEKRRINLNLKNGWCFNYYYA